MPNLEQDDDINTIYLDIFSEHVDDFRAHLAGKTCGDDPLPASYFAPRAFWTAAEKDVFFRALAVHSRLRPDLIAEEVKTKTVPDVCAYIAMLQQAHRQMLKKTILLADNNAPTPVKVARKDLPGAVEVSHEWISQEEIMAGALLASECALAPKSVLQDREGEVNHRRATIRAQRGRGRTASNERDREGEKERREEFEKWLAQKKADWEREDMLLSLDRIDLTTLERMLRDDEEGRVFMPEHSVNLPEDGLPTSPDIMLVDGSLDQHSQRTSTPGIGEELIDPVLLELSRAGSASASAASPSLRRVPHIPYAVANPQPRESTLPSTNALQRSTPPSPTPLPGPEYQARFLYPTPSSAPPVGTGKGSTLDGEDVSQMSPASRRRHKKRLYMRRKRAQATGAVINEDAVRLKPGRKPKKHSSPKGRSSVPLADDLHEQPTTSSHVAAQPTVQGESGLGVGGEGDDVHDYEKSTHNHHKLSGKTSPYKRLTQFVSKGVDAQRLHQEGLDLFHLQALSKLMQTYNELHDVSPSIGSEISAETLRLLRSLVVRFVSRVMSHAIVVREQERIAKLQTKAWRLTQNQVVSAANVKHALALHGADSLSKRTHFAGVLRKLGLDDNEDADEDRGASEEDEDEQTEDEDASQSTTALPLNTDADGTDEEEFFDEDVDLTSPPMPLLRTIFPPFIALPSLVTDTPDTLNSSIYMPWPSSLFSTVAESLHEEDLLPDETDEASLNRELYEEKMLDCHDCLRDAEGERALWTRVGKISVAPARIAATPIANDNSQASLPHTFDPPPRKRRRKGQDAMDNGGTDEYDVETEHFRDADDADVVEEVFPHNTRARKKRKTRTMKRMSQRQLMYREPDPNGRIKSSVYVFDSD